MKNEIIILKSWKRITKSFQDWNYDNKFKFKKALVSDEIKSLRSDFSRTAYDNVNEATDKLTEIIQLALQRVFPKRHHKNVPPKCQRHTKRETFFPAYQLAKRALRRPRGNSNG